jgi:hypothetical protein
MKTEKELNPIGVCLDDLLFPPEFFEIVGSHGDFLEIRSLDDPESEPIKIESNGFWRLS